MNGGRAVGEGARLDTQALGGPETSPGNGGLGIRSMSPGPGCVEKCLERVEPHVVWASPGPVCTFVLGVPTAAGSALEAQFSRNSSPVSTWLCLADGEATKWVVFCGEGCAGACVGGAWGVWGWEKTPRVGTPMVASSSSPLVFGSLTSLSGTRSLSSFSCLMDLFMAHTVVAISFLIVWLFG